MAYTRTALAITCFALCVATSCKRQDSDETTRSPAATASPSADTKVEAEPSPDVTPSPTPMPSQQPTPTPQPTATPTVTPRATPAATPEAKRPSLSNCFKVTAVTTSNDETLYDGETYFIDQTAAEYPNGIDGALKTVYYLDNQSWWLVDSSELITLVEAQEHVQEEAEKTRARLTDEVTPRLRRLMETLLDPQFEIEQTDDALMMTNEFMSYTIKTDQSLTDDQAERFFEFRRLEAYRKASIPPFTHFVVNNELRIRQMLPSEMVRVVETMWGETATIHTTMELEDVTQEEYEKVMDMLP